MDSTKLSRYHKYGWSQMSCIPCLLRMGFLASDDYGVGIVDNTVSDGISQQ